MSNNAFGLNLMAAVANCPLVNPVMRTRAGFLQMEFDRRLRAEAIDGDFREVPNPNSPWANVATESQP